MLVAGVAIGTTSENSITAVAPIAMLFVTCGSRPSDSAAARLDCTQPIHITPPGATFA
jgi:hypothetical protein